jgi:hypothetical protein
MKICGFFLILFASVAGAQERQSLLRHWEYDTRAPLNLRQTAGPEKFDAFAAEYSWLDEGKSVSHAAPAAMFVQYATD